MQHCRQKVTEVMGSRGRPGCILRYWGVKLKQRRGPFASMRAWAKCGTQHKATGAPRKSAMFGNTGPHQQEERTVPSSVTQMLIHEGLPIIRNAVVAGELGVGHALEHPNSVSVQYHIPT